MSILQTHDRVLSRIHGGYGSRPRLNLKGLSSCVDCAFGGLTLSSASGVGCEQSGSRCERGFGYHVSDIPTTSWTGLGPGNHAQSTRGTPIYSNSPYFIQGCVPRGTGVNNPIRKCEQRSIHRVPHVPTAYLRYCGPGMASKPPELMSNMDQEAALTHIGAFRHRCEQSNT